MHDTVWLWFAVGVLPYTIKRHQTKEEQTLSVRAFSWQLTVHWQQGRRSWEVCIPLIEHLRRE